MERDRDVAGPGSRRARPAWRAIGWWLIAAGIGLAGCRSAPAPRYYTLDLRPSGSARLARCGIRVGRWTLAGALEREEILVKTGPTEAEYYGSDRWLGPLEELVAGKLESEFGPVEVGRPVVVVEGVVKAFEEVDLPDGTAEGHARLDFVLRRDEDPASPGSPPPLLRKTCEARAPAGEPRPAAAAAALSRALERAAAEIAAEADRLAAGGK